MFGVDGSTQLGQFGDVHVVGESRKTSVSWPFSSVESAAV